MHVECALKPIVEYSDEGHTIQHFTHFHPLGLVDLNEDDKVGCSICVKPCSASAYACNECEFYLHKSCMSSIPRQFINHLMHPCTLILLIYNDYYNCPKCDEESFSALIFSCPKCDFKLHVKCALFPTIDSEGAKEIQHFSHPHPLALLENDQEYGNEPHCVACAEICLAPTPTFTCSRCNHFFLHKSCAVKLPYQPPKIQHPSHPKHQLTITSLPYKDRIDTCGACTWVFDRSLLAYSCLTDKCGFKLHLDCTKLLPSFMFHDHRHLLTLFEKTNYFTCHLCGVNCGTFILRCVPCNFNIHLQCLPSAPKTINHESHLHSLILTKSPFEFELNSNEEAYNSEDEFYCDVYEEKRYKRESVYYCAECKFIAELKCVISAVLPLIPKNDATQPATFSAEGKASSRGISDVERKLEELYKRKMELEGKLKVLTKELDDVIIEIKTTTDRLDTLVADQFMQKSKYLIESLANVKGRDSDIG